jgi:AspT/YidE/YbjL antiporter-like protein
MVIYSTRSANLMLRELGLSLFLACIGLDAGGDFFNIVIQPQGIVWVLLGFAITFIPIVIVGIISFWILKIDFGTVCGLICGSMANPMALNYANDLIPGDSPAIAYATVYPLGMFLRVIIAQAVLILLL